MTSVFDPETFLDTETSDTGDTRFTPIPAAEYKGIINKVAKPRVMTDGGVVLDILWEVLDDNIRQMMNRDKVLCKQSIWLDIEDGHLAFGVNQNVGLSKLRDAVKQNKSGKPWAPRMLEGKGPCLIQVSQKEKTDDSTIVYNNVVKVGTIA